MKFIPCKDYRLRSQVLTYVCRLDTRMGTLHRFRYSNGACCDVGPDEISQVKEIV